MQFIEKIHGGIDNIEIQPYIKSAFDYPPCASDVNNSEDKIFVCSSYVVPKDSYYLLGDNRGNSYDSRHYGAVHKDLMKGKALHIFYPFNRRRVVK